jgi:hypothetical protein
VDRDQVYEPSDLHLCVFQLWYSRVDGEFFAAALPPASFP